MFGKILCNNHKTELENAENYFFFFQFPALFNGYYKEATMKHI